jgi:hypothetical protein
VKAILRFRVYNEDKHSKLSPPQERSLPAKPFAIYLYLLFGRVADSGKDSISGVKTPGSDVRK